VRLRRSGAVALRVLVAHEAGVQVIGGQDARYAAGLGAAGTTYLDAERHNTDPIVKALGGRV
jgi:zinc/manganese transport system substrate-binding protein